MEESGSNLTEPESGYDGHRLGRYIIVEPSLKRITTFFAIVDGDCAKRPPYFMSTVVTTTHSPRVSSRNAPHTRHHGLLSISQCSHQKQRQSTPLVSPGVQCANPQAVSQCQRPINKSLEDANNNVSVVPTMPQNPGSGGGNNKTQYYSQVMRPWSLAYRRRHKNPNSKGVSYIYSHPPTPTPFSLLQVPFFSRPFVLLDPALLIIKSRSSINCYFFSVFFVFQKKIKI